MSTATEVRYLPSFSEVFFGEIANSYREARFWEEMFVFGTFSIKEVLEEVKNARWQRERVRMLSTRHEFKWNVLRAYLIANKFSRHSQVVVTNYVYALKRGGVIK